MRKFLLKSMASLMLISLVSCGLGQKKSQQTTKVDTSAFAENWVSDEAGIEGGVMKTALVSQSPFKGIFLPILSNDSLDSVIYQNIYEQVLLTDGNFDVVEGGPGSLSVDVDNKVLTVKIKEGMKWSDGHPLTIDDYIYTYELVAHPDYTGLRYDKSYRLVEGIEEYHAGKTKTISGLEKVSDTEVRIHVKEIAPTVLNGVGGLTGYFTPRHYLQDVPVKDLESSDKVRLHPLSYGRYILKKIVPGESVELVPNPYYYEKKYIPKVEKLIMKVIPESSVISSMKKGEFDFYSGVPANLYTEYKDLSNIAITGTTDLAYTYLGFNLGYWDAKKGENITDTNAKLYDINLRKAMAYAMNVEAVTKKFSNGLSERGNSPIPPAFKKYHTDEVRFTYNPEKAKEILDKAGYKDINGDGIREDKNGKPLEINVAFMAGGDTAEPVSKQYLQNWEEIGLKVNLATGRLIEFNSFYDKVIENNKEIDAWIGGWRVGTALDLTGVYAKNSKLNLARIASDKNEELINKTQSVEGVKNPQFRIDAVREWEKNYMENELGFIPLTFGYRVSPVNKRVKYSSSVADNSKLHKLIDQLTSKEAYIAK
ncbi:oligopeptide ABC transporter substrate-binding protein [Caviibacter abscessus]|uniref:oligopeptide ABC transporter substrate-binding protein n=1 Tax=Caviibacter abscessus TaxID=1766719 RepID=UPI000836F16B|nr:oligopeptide ABC transporter substrate-binding protein [Caviibacter abscessus]